MSPKHIGNYLAGLQRELFATDRRKPFSSVRAHYKDVPRKPGVYALFEGPEIVYVGETGSLRGRCENLCDTRNHSLRKAVGTFLFPNLPANERATAAKKFPDAVERQLADWMEKHLTISYLPVPLGRKELEEFIYSRHRVRYNSRGQRQK